MTWLVISDAPLNVLGHVWCSEIGARTDVLGTIYAYDVYEDGGRGVTSSAKGYRFTHWHPLPAPPIQLPPASELVGRQATHPGNSGRNEKTPEPLQGET